MELHNLSKDLGIWASGAVAWYRQVSLWPELGNTHETIVRVYLLQKLADAGFQVRIEVAQDALSRAIRSDHPGSMAGNRGGTDIVIGHQGQICALAEVKRGFPESSGDMERVVKDIQRLKALHEADSDIQKYVVVVLGAAWNPRTRQKVQNGLRKWRDRFGDAIVFIEDQIGMTNEFVEDSWVVIVIDAVAAI